MGAASSAEGPNEVIIDARGEYHRRCSAVVDPNVATEKMDTKEADTASSAAEKPATVDEKRGFVAAKDDDWQHADIYTRASGPDQKKTGKKNCLSGAILICLGSCMCCSK